MIKDLLISGFALKRKKHYKHAIEIFYKALEYDNESSELLLEIAHLYYLMNNEERALNYIERILEAEPMHIPSLKLLQQIFESKDALVEAEQTAKNIFCISKDNDDLVTIFKLLNKQGKYQEIFEYKIAEYSINIYFEQALAHFYMSNFTQAKDILYKILENDANSQEAIILLVKILYLQKQKEEASTLAKKIKVNIENPELMSLLAKIELYENNCEKAIEYLGFAIKKNNSNSEYYFDLGNIYYKQGENTLAKKYYNIAISLNSNNNNYHFALANLYYTEKHYKKALEELKGDFFEARLLKSVILYDTGYLALAKKELNKLEKESPDNAIVQNYKDRIEEELGIS